MGCALRVVCWLSVVCSWRCVVCCVVFVVVGCLSVACYSLCVVRCALLVVVVVCCLRCCGC